MEERSASSRRFTIYGRRPLSTPRLSIGSRWAVTPIVSKDGIYEQVGYSEIPLSKNSTRPCGFSHPTYGRVLIFLTMTWCYLVAAGLCAVGSSSSLLRCTFVIFITPPEIFTGMRRADRCKNIRSSAPTPPLLTFSCGSMITKRHRQCTCLSQTQRKPLEE